MMKFRRFLAGFLAMCMVVTAPCITFADETEDVVFDKDDVAIAVNTYLYADNAEKDNPMSKIKDAEIVFETSGLLSASEEDAGEEEYTLLQQALADTDDAFVEVVADEEDGLIRMERYFKPLDVDGLLNSSEAGQTLGTEAADYEVGQTKTFHDIASDAIRDVEIKCLAVGNSCTIWCEVDSDHSELTMSTAHANQLAAEFDSNWESFESYFGNYGDYPGYPGYFDTMDVDGDGKLAIVCYDINEAYKNATKMEDGRLRLNINQYTGGYFWSGDFYPEDKQEGSNQMDCIHIDTVCGMSDYDYEDGAILIIPEEEHIFGYMDKAYSTLYHELQHLTESAMTVFHSLPSYLDEAFAMAAEHLVCGSAKVSSRVNHFNKDYSYGCPLTLWCYYNQPMNCLDNYSSSYLFGQYLRTRYAQEGKSEITTGENKGADVYGVILNQYQEYLFSAEALDVNEISKKTLEAVFGVELEELVEDFWRAVCLQKANGKHSFSSDGVAPEEWSKAITPRYETELPSGKAKIYNGGVKFYQISENNTVFKASSVKNAGVFKVLNEKNSYKVEFKVASPSDAEPVKREYNSYHTELVEKGEKVQKPVDPDPEDYEITREDYSFSGWFEDTGLTYPFDFDDAINNNKVVYGSWIKNEDIKEITVTFNPNSPEGSEVSGTMAPQKAKAYTPFKLSKNQFETDDTLMEYEFVGWGTTPDLGDPECRLYQDQEEVVFTENTQLYALWKQSYDHIVIFDANGGKPNYCVLVDDGEIILETDVPNPTRSGYTFNGWWYKDDDGDFTTKYVFGKAITEDDYVFARWLKNSSGGGGSSSSGGSSAQAVKPDPAVTQITKAANGNQMLGNATISIKLENLSADEKAALVTKGSWAKDSKGYWTLKDEAGNVLKSCWALVSDALGSSPTGNATWYYLGSDGKMLTGWQWIPAADGKKYCYYFNKEDGSMYGGCVMGGTTVDGYSVDAKGRWVDAAGVEQTR